MRLTTHTSYATWGGIGDEIRGPVPHVVIHHSYKPALPFLATRPEELAAVRSIERFHREGNGWDGIGYNFLVAPSGRTYEGRGWGRKGAHAGPVNGSSVGICLMMDGSARDPTPESLEAVRWLVGEGVRLGYLAGGYRVSGHRDHMARTCPGDKLYRRLQECRHDWRG